MKRDLTCICCPLGCRMTAEERRGEWLVSGNSCPRGKTYALSEMTAPVRMVTTTLPVAGGTAARVPVKSERPVPKGEIFRLLRAMKGVSVAAPVSVGDAVWAEGDVRFVATGNIGREDRID